MEGAVGMKSDFSGVYAAPRALHAKHRHRHRENPDSKQMCCMWSASDLPEVVKEQSPSVTVRTPSVLKWVRVTLWNSMTWLWIEQRD